MADIFLQSTRPVNFCLGSTAALRLYCGSVLVWPLLAVLSTTAISNLAATSATSGGNITSDSGSSVTDRGICWGTSSNPTISDSHTHDGTGTGSFTSNMTGLTAGTTYYVRAYATNGISTSYGENVSFVAQGLASITTDAAADILSGSVTLGGNVTNNGGGTITERGVCYGYSPNPTTANYKKTMGTGSGAFSSGVNTQIYGDWKYYARAYAINAAGTVYGNEITFITPCDAVPFMNGIAVVSRVGTTVTFDIGLGSANATEVGICWNTTGTPTTADSKATCSFTPGVRGTVRVVATGITGAKYWRSYAISPCGTGYYGTTGYVY